MQQHSKSIPLLGRCLSAMDELSAELPEGTLVRLVFDQDTSLELLDKRIAQDMRYGLRMQLAPAEVPGYRPKNLREPNFVAEPTLMDSFCAFWEEMTVHYYGSPVEFVLLHCPYGYWDVLPDLGPAEYGVMVRKAEKTIHAIEAVRPIVVDGMDNGRYIPTDLFDLASNNVTLCTTWDMKNPQNTPERFERMLRLWGTYMEATGQKIACLLMKSPETSLFNRYLFLLEKYQIQVIQW